MAASQRGSGAHGLTPGGSCIRPGRTTRPRSARWPGNAAGLAAVRGAAAGRLAGAGVRAGARAGDGTGDPCRQPYGGLRRAALIRHIAPTGARADEERGLRWARGFRSAWGGPDSAGPLERRCPGPSRGAPRTRGGPRRRRLPGGRAQRRPLRPDSRWSRVLRPPHRRARGAGVHLRRGPSRAEHLTTPAAGQSGGGRVRCAVYGAGPGTVGAVPAPPPGERGERRSPATVTGPLAPRVRADRPPGSGKRAATRTRAGPGTSLRRAAGAGARSRRPRAGATRARRETASRGGPRGPRPAACPRRGRPSERSR